jgi:hypothetical protein
VDSNRFDRFSKLFANRRLTRRHALATGAASVAAGLAGSRAAAAQEATPTAGATPQAGDYEKITYLFVQSFQSGSITPNQNDDRYTLTLEHGLGQTIYFGDRPSREVGVSPTDTFLQGLGFSPDNPPNAALIVETGADETDFAVLELYEPAYDKATRTATYQVKGLETWEDELDIGLQEGPTDLAAISKTFTGAHLLIDDCSDGTVQCWNTDDGGTYWGDWEGLPFCYNYLVCCPCEPYGHTQPDRCSTRTYWDNKCVNAYSGCAAGDVCFSWFDSAGLMCDTGYAPD